MLLSSDDAVETARTADTGPVEARIAGRFRVLNLLGRGGTGEVYHVADEATGRELALKRLRCDHTAADPLLLALFEREYHTLAQLDHPCVVRVHDYGVDEAGVYYTMDLVHGETLRERGVLSWRAACSVLRDVASALGVLHARRWLHRDLSARNVMTRSGSDDATLIDFGAMAPLGATRRLVGTPPLVPPEAYHQQALDVRADLYSLGALGYYVLSGRHAYPAQRFEQLPDLWRTSPRPLYKLSTDIPPALSALVMELLSLDRAARPAFASAVIERLSALLGDASPARAETVASYLSSPRLVGREKEMIAARRQLAKTLRGKGSALLIEGEAGMGRSRFLDACVLDAKLLGASVLRAQASDSSSGAYGVVTRLSEQLLATVPHPASHAARLQRAVLAQIVPSLREPSEPAPAHDEGALTFERRPLQTALRDWFRAVARRQRLVIAVDDFDRIDEPSAALIASLVHRNERRKLVVIASLRSDAVITPAIELLQRSALRIELEPFSLAQSESLLESVFGNARDLAAVTQRAHELSGGNPAQLMQLIEHLVQKGHVRHVRGAWILPPSLGPEALPPSMDAALALRLEALSPDARELGEMLALRDPALLALPDYSQLLETQDHARVFAALSALCAACVLQADGDRYRFVHQRWPQLLESQLTQARRCQLHARWVAILQRGEDAIATAHHAMGSGQEALAIDLLLAAPDREDLVSELNLALLRRAVAAAERLGAPLPQRCQLHALLTRIAAGLCDTGSFLAHAPAVVPALELASGLRDVPQQRGTPRERVLRALELASQRSQALPEEQRPQPPREAIASLTQVVASCSTLALGALDAGLLRHAPSLAPLASFAPAIWVVQALRDAVRHSLAGRRARASELGREVLARVQQPDRAGMSASLLDRTRCGVLLALAESEVMLGHDQAALGFAELLERANYRSDAWRWQAIFHLMRGESELARRAERRAELVLLQDGAHQFGGRKSLLANAIACWLGDDLDGLKQLLDRFDAMAQRYPAWRVASDLVECHYLRLKGDVNGAFDLCEATRPRAVLGEHMLAPWVAAAFVQLATATGQARLGAEQGLHAIGVASARGLVSSDLRSLIFASAEALAAADRFEQAVSLWQPLAAELEAAGAQGVLMGQAYETRARIALHAQDQATFTLFAERCRQHYSRADSAVLGAKFGRLMQEFELQGAPGNCVVRPEGAASADAEPATERSRMQECISPGERARCALLVVLEHGSADEGHLYGLVDGKVSLLASVSEHPPSQALLLALEHQVEDEMRATLEADVTQRGRSSDRPPSRYMLVPLRGTRDGEPVIAAIVAIPRGEVYKRPPDHILSLLADTLLEHDDVDGR